MSSDRESGYVCAFSTASGDGRAWVRAWSAQQAQEMIRLQLRDEGVTGEVAVRVVEGPPSREETRRRH